MKHITPQEKAARQMLAQRDLGDLLNDWEGTTENHDPHIATVRGWIMDEIQKRDPEAFDRWLESDEARDEELRLYINGTK